VKRENLSEVKSERVHSFQQGARTILILTALNTEIMRRDSRFCKSRTIVHTIQYCECYLSACVYLMIFKIPIFT
jgi:hypothetical protein